MKKITNLLYMVMLANVVLVQGMQQIASIVYREDRGVVNWIRYIQNTA